MEQRSSLTTVLPGKITEPLALSGYFPGTSAGGRSKRTAQRELECHLEPKEKEHQRKKVLRNFLSWRYKQPMQTDEETKFWTWVKAINPDSVHSTDRFRSMNYEFLDKLLEKRVFREALEKWLIEYEANLVECEEDRKTRLFIKFIRDSMSLKLVVDRVKTELLAQLTPLDIDTKPDSPLEAVAYSHPHTAGIYAEAKCKRRDCVESHRKTYFHISDRGHYRYDDLAKLCQCPQCGDRPAMVNVGFANCRWIYAGELNDGRHVNGTEALVWGYSNYDEVKKFAWAELRFSVQAISEEEITYLRSALFSEPSESPVKQPRLTTEMAQRPAIYVQSNSEVASDYHAVLVELEGKNRELQAAKRTFRTVEEEVRRLKEEKNRLKSSLLKLSVAG